MTSANASERVPQGISHCCFAMRISDPHLNLTTQHQQHHSETMEILFNHANAKVGP